MRREGYVMLVSVVTAGILLTLGLLYFATHSGILSNLFPIADAKGGGSTLGVFAQNAQPGAGNLESTLPTRDPTRPTLTPRVPTPSRTPTAPITPSMMVTRIAQTTTPVPTMTPPAAIPASGTSTGMWLIVPVMALGGIYLRHRSAAGIKEG